MSDYKTFLEENAETLATIDAKRKEAAALTSFERMMSALIEPGSPEEAAEARRLMLPVDAYRMPGAAAARQKEIDDSAAVTWTLKAMTDDGLRHIAYEQRMTTDFGLNMQAEARLILESRAKAGSD